MAANDPTDFLGSGWAFPVQLQAGKVQLANAEVDVRQSIEIILGTALGERVMEPTFGCRLQELVFAEQNAGLQGLAAHYVEEALTLWEPRIQLKDVQVVPSADQEGLLLITINYAIRSRNYPQNLVYPFYLTPS
jgi:phage baseplate assembly protein W